MNLIAMESDTEQSKQGRAPSLRAPKNPEIARPASLPTAQFQLPPDPPAPSEIVLAREARIAINEDRLPHFQRDSRSKSNHGAQSISSSTGSKPRKGAPVAPTVPSVATPLARQAREIINQGLSFNKNNSDTSWTLEVNSRPTCEAYQLTLGHLIIKRFFLFLTATWLAFITMIATWMALPEIQEHSKFIPVSLILGIIALILTLPSFFLGLTRKEMNSNHNSWPMRILKHLSDSA